MVRLLAVSDREEEVLWGDEAARMQPDLVIGCGDLHFDYLQWLGEASGSPIVFVPGNHDPDLSGYRINRRGLVLRAGLPAELPWPPGAFNADCQVVDIAGLRIAGLGGSPRYREGPNQYGERQQTRRARRLIRRARRAMRRDRRPVDILLLHTPPRGVGDQDDQPHRGFPAHLLLVSKLQPRLVLHGHVDPPRGVGSTKSTGLKLGGADVVNVTGHRLFDFAPWGE
jgi:predicted phosphodiesterase